MEKFLTYVGKSIGKCIGLTISIGIVALVFGLPVMFLWNWLMVSIFNLPRVTFLQAFGLYLLCDLFFKKNELYN